jgi:protein arginine kinase
MLPIDDIVISSRVRLARNLRGAHFPGWASEADRVRICGVLRAALTKTDRLAQALFLDMGEVQDAERALLRERHLISNELAERGPGSGLLVSQDEHIAVMINEEDHLRMQAIEPGFALPAAWQQLDALDSELERLVEYVYSPRLGYVTACPSNVGTGLRASVMLHLPGLKLTEEVEPVMNGLEKLGFAIRGLWGEGSEAWGNMFQVSNLSSLGETEQAIVQGMETAILEVVTHEANARARLLESRKVFVLDQVGRAVGILNNARILSSREAIELLSIVRLGLEMGLIRNLEEETVNQLMLLTQPGHLQKLVNKDLQSEERDEVRATMIRNQLIAAVVRG